MSPDFKRLAEQYGNALLGDVIPFWERHSRDDLHGGYFTCLDREGRVYDTDKFVWLQARQVWTFASLYNRLEKRPEWLETARLGARFLREHGRAADGSWYFALTREGAPLVQPYNIFSDCFAAMAFAQLAKATGDEADAAIARRTFENILQRRDNPKGAYDKAVPATRPLKGFSLPMILSNLALELESAIDPALAARIQAECVHEVMEVFLDPDSGLIRENVRADGGFSDSFDGRLLNPGHAIEAMGFILDLAARDGDRGLVRRAVDTALLTLQRGWDEDHGGLFYFLDLRGRPPQQLEWDQKLWWVHVETLVTMLKGYLHTRDPRCLAAFEKVHDYAWSRFPDPDFGEWFGYLNRRGEILLPLKGGKWKGCFHVPRGLFQCWKILERL